MIEDAVELRPHWFHSLRICSTTYCTI